MTNNIMIQDMAVALYDGGWRAKDKKQFTKEYNLHKREAELIADWLEYLEDNDINKEEEEYDD